MKKFRAISIMLIMIMAATMMLSGCGGSSDSSASDDSSASAEAAKITIVQQYGMAYAPFQIMEQQQLVERKRRGNREQHIHSGRGNHGNDTERARSIKP